MSSEMNIERTICTSECIRAVYITMTQKTEKNCLSTQSQATSKFAESKRSRLLKKKGYCMCLLATHQLKTTIGSFRSIKSRFDRWRYMTFMWLTTYGARVSNIWKERPQLINLPLWQATWYSFWKIWQRYINTYIWRHICSLLTISLYFLPQGEKCDLQLSTILLTEKWRSYSRPSNRYTVIAWSVGSSSKISM